LRREPLETRKATLASLLRGSLPGLRLNGHLAHDGESVFQHACKMGLEGIVSKRLGSHYRSGRWWGPTNQPFAAFTSLCPPRFVISFGDPALRLPARG